jgi:hypothetical protein
MTQIKKWCSPTPDRCDICLQPIDNDFVDGRLARGPWATLCLACHATQGVGLGTGRGQQYRRIGSSNTFRKVAG